MLDLDKLDLLAEHQDMPVQERERDREEERAKVQV
jgi:hypothetical protein